MSVQPGEDSAEANIAVIKRLCAEVWHGGAPEAVAELISPAFVDNRLDWEEGLQLGGVDQGTGYASFVERVNNIRRIFPDCHVTFDDLFATADRVIWRWTMTGTYQQALNSDYPVAGQSIKIRGISIYRVAGGQVVERWVSQDVRGLLQQIGRIAPSRGEPRRPGHLKDHRHALYRRDGRADRD